MEEVGRAVTGAAKGETVLISATPMLMKMVLAGRLQPKKLATHLFQLDAR